jgi:hypothetical protein
MCYAVTNEHDVYCWGGNGVGPTGIQPPRKKSGETKNVNNWLEPQLVKELAGKFNGVAGRCGFSLQCLCCRRRSNGCRDWLQSLHGCRKGWRLLRMGEWVRIIVHDESARLEFMFFCASSGIVGNLVLAILRTDLKYVSTIRFLPSVRSRLARIIPLSLHLNRFFRILLDALNCGFTFVMTDIYLGTWVEWETGYWSFRKVRPWLIV